MRILHRVRGITKWMMFLYCHNRSSRSVPRAAWRTCRICTASASCLPRTPQHQMSTLQSPQRARAPLTPSYEFTVQMLPTTPAARVLSQRRRTDHRPRALLHLPSLSLLNPPRLPRARSLRREPYHICRPSPCSTLPAFHTPAHSVASSIKTARPCHRL